jgi:phosphatidate cytidylyltransferase
LIFFGYAVFKAGAVKFQQIMAGLFGSIAIGYSFSAFLRMEQGGIHRAYLLLPFILSFACDTFAFFAGLTLGRHKLAPKVSPKKTVEGSIGGLLGNLACGLLFAFVMDRWFGGSIGYGPMAALALACGVVAQLGDLSFSLIKREFGIKDYGRLFLEHGGVLDRFDSVLFVTPVIEIILNLVK